MSGTIEHSWNGTILTITSDSGTSSADLKGTTGDTGPRGPRGLKGNVNITSVNGQTGVVQLTAEDVGALPNTTVIPTTAQQVGARADDWLPTAEEVGARANDWLPTPAEIGGAAIIHTHSFDDISGVATIAHGGTGASTSAEARANLEITPANIGAEPVITNLPISKGGTGATTRKTALENMLTVSSKATDANSCLDVGIYYTDTNTTNLPFSTYGTLTVYKSAQNWIIQIWTSSTSAESSMYMRKNINGEGFGSWHKLLGSDSPVSIAQGGTGGTKLEEAQKNLLDGTYPAEGTDLSKLAPGIYGLPNDSNNVINAPVASWSPLAFVFGHQNNDIAADGSHTGTYFQGYLDWEGELWLRRRKWNGWGDWMKYYSTKNIIYSSTQPSNASTGTIWLKPV